MEKNDFRKNENFKKHENFEKSENDDFKWKCQVEFLLYIFI